MKQFAFRLQRLLDLRCREERELQQQLAAVDRARAGLLARLRDLEARRRGTRDLRRTALVGPLAMADLRMHAGVARQQDALASNLVDELARMEPTRRSLRSSLAKAMAARRAIERLRERAYECWKRDRQRHERRAEQDVVSQGAMA